MTLLRYLLIFSGIALLVGAISIVAWDLYQILKWRKNSSGEGSSGELQPGLRWYTFRRLATLCVFPLLAGLSIAVGPSGWAGVRVNQFAGTRPGTLYPGVHLILPLIEDVELYSTRDSLFSTVAKDDPKKNPPALRVQTREGLAVGMAVVVRYRMDPSKLAYIHANLPQPVEEEMVAPAIASTFRDLAPNYLVRELFSTKRDEFRQTAAGQIATRLKTDGIVGREGVLRAVRLRVG